MKLPVELQHLAWRADPVGIRARGKNGRHNLARMRALLAHFEHPEGALPFIHITGTNGKTTTTRATSAVLEAHGLRVGTITSPHLSHVTERVVLRGAPISHNRLCKLFDDLLAAERELGLDWLTFYELIAAAALIALAEDDLDAAVVEVGIGGRFDATNVIDGRVNAITSVGMDHAAVLGNTIEKIAADKAGIVKESSTCILGPGCVGVALETILSVIPPSATVVQAGSGFGANIVVSERTEMVVDVRLPSGATVEGILTSLCGRHYADNLATALAISEAFLGTVDAVATREAIGALRVRGRSQHLPGSPPCVVDGAHNPHGARELHATLRTAYPDARRIGYVIAMSGDRDPAEFLRALEIGVDSVVVAVEPTSAFGVVSPEAICEAATALGATALTADGPSNALRALRRTRVDLVVATGSFAHLPDAEEAASALATTEAWPFSR